MEKLTNIVNHELNNINQVIQEDLSSQVVLINSIAEYIISGGGKRIRPLLVVLSSKCLGFNAAIIYKMATMIEYIHTATLLHDDVVDESNLRRGRKTANSLFGNPASVLVGDFIYTRAFQLMVTGNSLEILKVMANSTNLISEGEVMQLLNIGRGDLTFDEYFTVIESKTAKLFEAGVKVAGILANANQIQTEALVVYAKALGTAFQIVDDVLDYQGDSSIMGKNIGDDLREGKVTLPLIYLLAEATSKDKNFIQQLIEKPSEEGVSLVINWVKNSNALALSIAKAQEYVAIGQQALTQLPQNQYNELLAEILVSSLKRVS